MRAELFSKQYELLVLLQQYRFATTKQLAQLLAKHYDSWATAYRQITRHLNVLLVAGLVYRLDRRIGGWQYGSAPMIWTLTVKGARQVNPEDATVKRLRPKTLSTTFLDHALAITELRVQLEQVISDSNLKLRWVQVEPACHRSYVDRNGTAAILKPDLTCAIQSSAYEDFYFMEVDRATENPARVIRKCQQYVDYQQTGQEQKQHGVFPAVIWTVPNDKRREQLRRYIQQDSDLPKEIFRVVTLDQLPELIRVGVTEFPK